MTRRFLDVPDSRHYTDADWSVREQIEQDDLYREIGSTLDLLKTAMQQAGSDDVSEDTRAALDQAELALVDAIVSRCEDVEEQLPQESDA
jgi:hypothetical protein